METDYPPAETLERVAELAGVSRSTVSRVLNDDDHVKASTREKVLEVVAREGYVLNQAARGLASGRAGTIGIVISVDLAHLFSDPFFAALLKALYSAARDRELVVSVWLLEDDGDPKTINQITRGSTLDGAVVAAGRTNDPIVEALSASNKPFVLLGRPANGASMSYVDIDNRAATRDATRHLLRNGRRRIAHLAGPEIAVAAIDRRAGYLDALEEAGIPLDLNLVHETDFTAADARIGTRRVMEHNPDAILAANDVMAMSAMSELAARGVRVPEDVAVVGFDDLAAASQADPPLTTVRQSIRLLASEAIRTLNALIEDRSIPPQQVVIPTELIVRTSCGAHLPTQGEK
jgi:DNA-binding LacI/PurR family transcriptional regulator